MTPRIRVMFWLVLGAGVTAIGAVQFEPRADVVVKDHYSAPDFCGITLKGAY
jgi:hypothetical protein